MLSFPLLILTHFRLAIWVFIWSNPVLNRHFVGIQMGIPKCNWWVSYCLLTPSNWDIDSARITYDLFISAGGPELSMERRMH